MKRALLITLALVSCFAAKAQLQIVRPSETFWVPNISRATYINDTNNDNWEKYDGNPLYYDLYGGNYTWHEDGIVNDLAASSTLSSQGSNSYHVYNLYDRNHETAWVEGVSGQGVGQWIEYRGVKGCGISKIKILNGYVKSDAAWSNNSRVKRLKVYCNNHPICVLELQNSRSLQTFDVEYLIADYYTYGRNTLRFEILEVYPGAKYQDTVISELYFE